MQKKIQVFVSSTYKDLKEAREKVIKALHAIDIFPIGMEFFPAASINQESYIKDKIKEADIVVVIIGSRYGSVISEGPNKGISYTELEYRTATLLKKPILAFLPNDLNNNALDKQIDSSENLNNFKESLKQSLVNFWDNPDHLATQVIISIINEIKYTFKINIEIPEETSSDKFIEDTYKLKRDFYMLGVNDSIRKLITEMNIFQGISLKDFDAFKNFENKLDELLGRAPLLKRSHVYRHIRNFNDILKIYTDYIEEISTLSNGKLLYNQEKYGENGKILYNKNLVIVHLLIEKYDNISNLI